MKALFKSLSFGVVFCFLTACSHQPREVRLAENEIDQKSYAIAYGATAQTYAERVNASYDIKAFMKGVNEWLNKKVPLPVEQIRASLLNRMLDHNVYAYYSGVLYAAELQTNFNRLSPNCWSLVQIPSLSLGVQDAMFDLQKNNVRGDEFIKNGVDQILHLCVKTMVDDEKHKKSKPTKK